jgi:nucleolar protein 56
MVQDFGRCFHLVDTGCLQLLFESSLGYALFTSTMAEEIGQKSKAVQDQIQNLATFGKMVQLKSFLPFRCDLVGKDANQMLKIWVFRDAAHALENANDVSEGA